MFIMPINVPIILTWLRIAMIPLVVGLFYIPGTWMAEPARDTLAAWAFIVAALTDWFDGWLARRWNQTSAFRSEEHTSELQSLMRISYAVFCLKKKKIHNI